MPEIPLSAVRKRCGLGIDGRFFERGLRDAGSAVLLVSAELEEVTALADRLLVISKGKFVGEVNPKETSNEEIGLMMTGGK